MIALTSLVAAVSIAYVLEKRIVTASVFALVPSFDLTLDFTYPFVAHGIMHSFLAASTASFLVYIYSEDMESTKSCFIGYSSTLFLQLITFTAIPVFYPFTGDFSIGIVPETSLFGNAALISFFLGAMVLKKNRNVFDPVVEFR